MTTTCFTVGQRVETEYGAGRVAESSARRVYIELDDGQSLNVGTGTYGYERIHALTSAPQTPASRAEEPTELAASAKVTEGGTTRAATPAGAALATPGR